MNSARLHCPVCQGLFEVDASAAGHDVLCPQCQHAVAVPADLGLPAPGQGAPTPGSDEAWELACPLCQGMFQVLASMGGHEVMCPHCQNPVAVPALNLPAPPPPPLLGADAAGFRSPPSQTAPRTPGFAGWQSPPSGGNTPGGFAQPAPEMGFVLSPFAPSLESPPIETAPPVEKTSLDAATRRASASQFTEPPAPAPRPPGAVLGPPGTLAPPGMPAPPGMHEPPGVLPGLTTGVPDMTPPHLRAATGGQAAPDITPPHLVGQAAAAARAPVDAKPTPSKSAEGGLPSDAARAERLEPSRKEKEKRRTVKNLIVWAFCVVVLVVALLLLLNWR